ncbi:MAG: esterase [Anaerolineales bacterium]|nr:esterase [Anaerolineales bacterium]
MPVEDLGLFLPHEHLFTDLRGPTVEDYARADPVRVGSVMKPFLDAARDAGVAALAECSTVGVGRNLEVLNILAAITPIYIIAPTGVYRDAYIPQELRGLQPEELAERWIADLTEGIQGTEIRAGFIKIAVSDEGLTPLEVGSLKAAARANQQTGALVASHTPSGGHFCNQMEILEGEELNPARFVWVHANIETDMNIHVEAARRGVYVELDAIGTDWQSQEDLITYVLNLLDAGCEDQVLLSHDAGWYDPSQPDGHPAEGEIRGFTSLIDQFIPALKGKGVSDKLIHRMTVENPARAFAFSDHAG